MTRIHYPLVEELDHLRSLILGYTLQVPLFRQAFCSRPTRLLCLFLLSFMMSLTLGLLFPLWVLAIGPIVYGVPHLFSSVRYFHYHLSRPEQLGDSALRKRAFVLLLSLCAIVCLFRLVVNLNVLHLEQAPLSEWKGSSFLEPALLVFTIAAAGTLYRKSLAKVFTGITLTIPLLAAFWFQPAWTVGAMVLIHNFVAFVFWIQSARSPAEKGVALLAFTALVATTAALFLGYFDPLLEWAHPSPLLPFAGLSFEALGRMIAPWSAHARFWTYAAVAYAFGQSLHYFVWLKAIPDQHHYHPVPTSFRQCVKLLEQDFGVTGCLLVVLVCVGSLGIWAFFQFPLARLTYFAWVAFHGYLEIAGLALGPKR